MFFKIAILNLLKHKKRSLLVLFGIFASVVLMVVFSGMVEGLKINFNKNMLDAKGHIQIHLEGYKDRLNPLSLDYPIVEPDRFMEELSGQEGTKSVEKLLFFGGLLIYGDENIGMSGLGISSDTAFYTDVRDGMIEGSFLPGGEGIALSKTIADLLGITFGDDITILVEDSQGAPFYMAYPVTGIFESANLETDQGVFFISHENSEDLLDLYDTTSEIRILMDDPQGAREFLDSLEGELTARGLFGETWKEINGSLISFVGMMDIFTIFLNIFMIIVVATVITNSILMSTFERIREFGTLRAIGLKSRQLFWMILSEGSVLGITGSVLGMITGLMIVAYFAVTGIDISAVGEILGGTKIIYFSLDFGKNLINLVSGILVALVGSLYAAMVSTKLSIMDSLRYS